MRFTPGRIKSVLLLLSGIVVLVAVWFFAASFPTPQAPIPTPTPAPCGAFAGPLTPDNLDFPKSTPSQPMDGGPTLSLPGEIRRPGNTRAGFGLSTRADPKVWAQHLGAAWYLDWTVQPTPADTDLVYWQMIRVAPGCSYPTEEVVKKIAARYPGQVWIIGNEPDVIWQDNLPAAAYAEIYHRLYGAIKEADPTAQVAVAGISQATPLRLQYLDAVLQHYQETYGEPLPVDWWTVHGFVLREERGSWGVDIPPGMPEIGQGQLYEVSDHGRLDLFQSQLQSFRSWLKQRGYQDTPVALTEFGILMPADYGFDEGVISAYLSETFTWLNTAADEQTGYPNDGYHLVQRWAWFSLADPIYPASNLANLEDEQLTAVGVRYQQVLQELRP